MHDRLSPQDWPEGSPLRPGALPPPAALRQFRDLTVATFAVCFHSAPIHRRTGRPVQGPDLPSGGFEFLSGHCALTGAPLARATIWLDAETEGALDIAPRLVLARLASVSLGGEGAALLWGAGGEGLQVELRRDGRPLILAQAMPLGPASPAEGVTCEIDGQGVRHWPWAADQTDARPGDLTILAPALADLQPAQVFAATFGHRVALAMRPAADQSPS